MSRRIYSAVVDCNGIFPSQAHNLVWSLIYLAGVSPDCIILNVVNAQDDPFQYDGLRGLGVEIVKIEPYLEHPYCNKLQQLKVLENRSFSDVVLLDCDTIVIEQPPILLEGAMAKPVDFPNPDILHLEHIFQKAGLSITYGSADLVNEPTVLGNANGGVYVVAGKDFKSLSSEWRRWADWGLEHKALFREHWKHIDQVSFAMAIAALKMPFSELPRRFNFPTHVIHPAARDCVPAIIHYHRALDGQQLLLEVDGLESVNKSIRDVNKKILAHRRMHFDNSSFWNARYNIHPELGSGIGSRGEILRLKRELLNKAIHTLDAKRILDVGCGDGQVVSEIPMDIEITGIDVAYSSREIYQLNRTGSSWHQHNIVSSPILVDPDMVICFDLLIHLLEFSEYESALNNLLAYKKPVVLSGFEAAPVESGPMTYFHEALSISIDKRGFIPIPLGAYRGLSVFLAIPNINTARANDLKDLTLRHSIPFLAEPIHVYEALISSRKYLGFFPDHLPRCIEYPWILGHLSHHEPLRIVDAGAGVSVLPFMLSSRGHQVTTVDSHLTIRDLSTKDTWNEWGFFDYSKIDSRINSVHIPFEEFNTEHLLDAIVSVSVIEHLSRKKRELWIQSAYKNLAPGGSFLLTVDTDPFSDLLWNYSEGRQVEDPIHHGSIIDLREDLLSAGFLVSLVERLPWMPMTRVGMARFFAHKPIESQNYD